MKRSGQLFEKIFSRDNLYFAYMDARRGKRKKRACFEFEKNLGGNLEALHSELQDGTYSTLPYFRFMVREPKVREICAPAFRDVVVQHAIYRVVYGIFDKTFINTSFACRYGYGTHRASNYTQKALRNCGGDEYTLKLDIRRFFYSIDRSILKSLIARKIKDKRLVSVMMKFAEMPEPVGIPIGNLLSQIYALVYLNPLDHFIKRQLNVKKYVRYVDDFILIGMTRPQCAEAKRRIVEFIDKRLRISLSRSTIQKVKYGLNFVGYRTWRTRRVIRKYSLYKFRRRANSLDWPAIISLIGHAKGTNSIPYMMKIIKEATNDTDIKLPKSYRRIYNTLTKRA